MPDAMEYLIELDRIYKALEKDAVAYVTHRLDYDEETKYIEMSNSYQRKLHEAVIFLLGKS